MEQEQLPETSEIQKLDGDTIRRITAEQAISDLPSIVKELIDNALDAESTTIKIRLFGHGLDIIEVSDDGNGVPVGSLPYMATRHATSKIECLEDIYEGTGLTMGFRGEALFAMACVSDSLVVASRTEDDELATKLLYGKDGKPLDLKGNQMARKVGTTVAVVKPFGNLPARRADLVRRIKQERTKIFKLVESYGIFNVGVGFRLMDIHNNREDMALATSASSTSLKETASTLLGPAFLKGTTNLEVCLEPFFRKKQSNAADADICYNWGVKGLISSEPSLLAAQQRPQRRGGSFGGVSSAKQASSKARIVQYYSINGRVVDLPKVTALLKRLWTNATSSMGGLKQKKPSAVLEFTLPNNAFDINLSPDKKTVLLTHEEELLQIIEEHVTKMWSDESSNVFVDGSLSQIQEKNLATSKEQQSVMNTLYEKEEDNTNREYYGYEYDEDESPKHKRRFAFVHDISKAKMQHDHPARRASDDNNAIERKLKQTKLTPVVEESNPTPVVEQPQETRKTMRDALEEGQPEIQQTPNKKVKLSTEVDCETYTKTSPTQTEEEQERLPSPEDKVTDLDRRKWTEIQSKFSRSNNGVNDSSMEHELSTHENGRGPQNEEAVVPSKAETATSEETTIPSPSSLPRRNLEEFTFQSKNSSDVDNNDRYQRSKRTSSMPPPEKRPSLLNDNKVSEDKLNQEGRPSKKRRESVPPPTTDSDDRIQNDRIAKDIKDTSIQTTEMNESETATSDSSPIVWKCFSSTEDISLSSRMERLDMKKRKRDIDIIRRSIREQMNAGNKENNRRSSTTSSENDVAKEVAFDDDGDGNEDDSGLIRMPKSTFRSGMQVIGQFNLGFILARCSRNHLWILDQHACDEKYNYEQLIKNTVMHQQPLIRPLPLELTPSEEACVLDHMEIFEANGFRFSFDDKAPIRHRLSLTALPHSGAHEGRKAVQFGPSDVSTLCSILTEGSSYDAGSGGTGTDGSGMHGNNAVRRHAGISSSSDRLLARLPKAIAMFASRACRTSIMIGTALSHKEMSTVVQKLAKVDMPWNCPHGRPTMRHVANVLPMMLKDERKAAEHIAVPTITVVPMTQEEGEQQGN
mmetsp:Transcript_15990/g.40095  ORF Transcript_15990/g.40095 Transcript_15990/m.40095 type:complete len:1090 (-) Transcript_15990:65-3334(-)